MKKIIIILVLQIIGFNANAQLTNLIVKSNPSSKIATWGSQQGTIVFIVTGNAAVGGSFKIKTEIQTSDGTVIGKTDLTRSRSYVLTAGNSVYNADDVVPLEYMMFSGSYQNNLSKSGSLPSETYKICVQLVTNADFMPISTLQCKTFTVAAVQLPVLMKPYNEEVLDATQAKTAITFRWTPLVPRPNYSVTYKLLVFEVLQGQNSAQAIRSNMPILEQNILGATQYIWLPKGILDMNPADEDGNVTKKKVAWTIQTFENSETPVYDGSVSGDAVSEPSFFFIDEVKKKL